MKLQPAADRQAVRDDLEILSLETLAERGRKSLARLAADKRSLVGEAAAFGERLVDRDVARLTILDEAGNGRPSAAASAAAASSSAGRGVFWPIFKRRPVFSSRSYAEDMRK
jgi:hypothetical protein